MKNEQQKGVTLLELIVTITLIAILATFAMPNYRSFVERQKIRSAANEWQSAYYFSQREAIRLKQAVTFCGSNDGEKCSGNGNAADFSNGWIIFYGKGEEKVILQDKAFQNDQVKLQMSGKNFQEEGFKFLANGRVKSGSGTLTVQMKDGNNPHKIEIKVNIAGRLRAES